MGDILDTSLQFNPYLMVAGIGLLLLALLSTEGKGRVGSHFAERKRKKKARKARVEGARQVLREEGVWA